MPTFQKKIILINDGTDAILTLYETAILQLPEVQKQTLGVSTEPTPSGGGWPQAVKEGLQWVTHKKWGAKACVLGAIEYTLSESATELWEKYLISMNDSLELGHKTAENAIALHINSRYVLIRELLLRFSAIALSDEESRKRSGKPILEAMMKFVDLVSAEKDLEVKFRLYIGGEHTAWLERLNAAVEMIGCIHAPENGLSDLTGYVSHIRRAIQAHILVRCQVSVTKATLDSSFIQGNYNLFLTGRSHVEETVLISNDKNQIKRVLDLNADQLRQVDRFKGEIQSKLGTLFLFLNRTELLYQTVSRLTQVIKTSSWILLLTDQLHFGELIQHLITHAEECNVHLNFSPHEVKTTYPSGCEVLLRTGYLFGQKITQQLHSLCQKLGQLDNPYQRQLMQKQLTIHLNELMIYQKALGLTLIRVHSEQSFELPDASPFSVKRITPAPESIEVELPSHLLSLAPSSELPTETKESANPSLPAQPIEEKKPPYPPQSPDEMPQPTGKATASVMPSPTEVPTPLITATPTDEETHMSEDTHYNPFDFSYQPFSTNEKKEKSEADRRSGEISDQENSEEETQDREAERESFPPQQIKVNPDGTTSFTRYIQAIFLSGYADVGLKERFIQLQNQYLGLQEGTGGKTLRPFAVRVEAVHSPRLKKPDFLSAPALIKHHQGNQISFSILGIVEGVAKYTPLDPIPELLQLDFDEVASLSASAPQYKKIYEEIRSKGGHLPAEHALMSLNDPHNFIAEFEKESLFANAPPFCRAIRTIVRRFAAHCMEAERPIGWWPSQKLRYAELWDARHIELLYFKFLCVEIAKRNGDERDLKELVEIFIEWSETTFLSGYDGLKDDFKALMKKKPPIQKYFGMTSDKKQAARIRRLKDEKKEKSLEINTLNKSLHKEPQGSQQASESQTGVINAKLLEENNQKLKAELKVELKVELLAELRNDPPKLPEKTDVIDHLSTGKKVKDQNSNSYKPVLGSAQSSSRSPKAKKQHYDDVKDKIINAPQPEAGGCILL